MQAPNKRNLHTSYLHYCKFYCDLPLADTGLCVTHLAAATARNVMSTCHIGSCSGPSVTESTCRPCSSSIIRYPSWSHRLRVCWSERKDGQQEDPVQMDIGQYMEDADTGASTKRLGTATGRTSRPQAQPFLGISSSGAPGQTPAQRTGWAAALRRSQVRWGAATAPQSASP